MSEKDKANPRQRQIMEKRWADAREKCAAKTCPPASRYHIAGCERRTQKVKVTNLNTGVTSEATIVHSDARAVKDVLDQHEKKAVKLTPLHEEVTFLGDEYWDAFERGEPGARNQFVIPEDRKDVAAPAPALDAPTHPWWKFWGRRG